MRFKGKRPIPDEDIERIRSLPNTTVLDDSSPHMLLVEAPESELKMLFNSMPEWVMSQERIISLPDPRPKPRQSKN